MAGLGATMTDDHDDEPARVRRRRILRAAAAGGVVAATAALAALVAPLVGPDRQAVTVTASVDPRYRPLDGYRVTVVPDGLRVGTTEDGSATYAVSKDQLHNDRAAPTSEHPTAATTLRTYVRADGGNQLWISVLRPERTTAGVDRAVVGAWLTGWSVQGADVIETYELPAGRARLARTVGSEVTAHSVVITAPDGVVIGVGGNAAVPVADLKAVAAGILPE